MSERIEHIIARLEERGAETVALFEGLTPAQWSTEIYGAEGDHPTWTARDMLCHFISAERAFILLFDDIRQGGEGSPPGFDIDLFNRKEVAAMAGEAPPALLERFRTTRAAMIEYVRGLDDGDLEREGRHPFFGVDKVEKFLKLVYRHNSIHERDLRRSLGL